MSNGASSTRTLRTLGLLTGGALHEISNPLVGLLGSAELALDDAEPGTKLHQRIARTHSTALEISAIVRALQGFIRLQDEPPAKVALGDAAADAIALVELVLPTRGVTLTASGEATVFAAPGEVQCSLVELLVEALEHDGPISLTIRAEGTGAVVEATGGGELRLPAAEVAA
jgi:signal transduction histidine kinase